MNTNAGVDNELFENVAASLRRGSENGAWSSAGSIGMDCGFERRSAAMKVKRYLVLLICMGLAEEERTSSPIIYRWKKPQPSADRLKAATQAIYDAPLHGMPLKDCEAVARGVLAALELKS